VEENADKNQVSISAVRGYIQRNKIDQNGDRKRRLFDEIHRLMEANPKASIYWLAKEAKVDHKTAKRYAEMTDRPEVKKGKQTALKPGFSIVKSVYFREKDILGGIIELYLTKNSFDADMTYSEGGFYRHITQPRLKYDIAPKMDDVRPLEEFDKLANDSLESVVIDLPFFAGANPGKLYYAKRYGMFHSLNELLDTHADMMRRATQKLMPKGLLVIKTQSFVHADHQVWTNYHLYDYARELNLEMVDEFVLVNRRRLIHITGEQQHARRFHAYFLCFRKRGEKRAIGKVLGQHPHITKE
jgi:hypothetical protein